MDITPQDNTTTQPISDDQELAKALAGVLPDEPEPAAAAAAGTTTGLQFEETPAPGVTSVAGVAPATVPGITPAGPAATSVDAAGQDPSDFTIPSSPATPLTPSLTSAEALDSIKSDALSELRPLIDHVDLPPEEKFDTYLMLIRSTDDTSLIAPAHEAAQQITDEKRKAEALLDVIREIDYLSRKDQPVADVAQL